MSSQTLPRFFSVSKSESNDPEKFDLVVVGPSPKFPGLTAFSAFRSSTPQNRQFAVGFFYIPLAAF